MASTNLAKLFIAQGLYQAGTNYTSSGLALREDTVSGVGDVSASILVSGSTDTTLVPGGGTAYQASLGPVAVDGPLRKVFFVNSANSGFGAPVGTGIYAASTSNGSVTSTPIYTIPTQSAGFYTNIGGMDVNTVTQTLYFSQDVADSNVDPLASATGIYAIPEAGGTARMVVSGVAFPTALALDVADNLLFFDNSTSSTPEEELDVNGNVIAVNQIDVANLSTGAVTTLLTEPNVQSTFNGGTTGYGGVELDGIAVDPSTHTLYYTTNSDYYANNGMVPGANGTQYADTIEKASFTVTGSGATATASMGSSTTLYSGSNAFSPRFITLDVPAGVFYVVGETQSPSYNTFVEINQAVYEGSLNATNNAPLTEVTPLSETSGGISGGAPLYGLAIYAAPGVVGGATVTVSSGSVAMDTDSGLTVQPGTATDIAGATVTIASGFKAGDTLSAANSGGITASYDAATGVLSLTGAASAAAYQAELDGVTFSTPTADLGHRTISYVVTDGNLSSLAATSTVVACFCAGTLIRTPSGETPVEALQQGGLVTTASGETRPIRWIGRRSYAGRFICANPAILPIRIRAGALADGIPAQDLYVSPHHALFMDGVLVPAGDLVNGHSITRVPAADRVDYFHIELDSHDVLVANGAPPPKASSTMTVWACSTTPPPARAPVAPSNPAPPASAMATRWKPSAAPCPAAPPDAAPPPCRHGGGFHPRSPKSRRAGKTRQPARHPRKTKPRFPSPP